MKLNFYKRAGVTVCTSYCPPPIPGNSHDWSAIDYSTYDGQESDPVGYGATEEEAIQDLLSWLEIEDDSVQPQTDLV